MHIRQSNIISACSTLKNNLSSIYFYATNKTLVEKDFFHFSIRQQQFQSESWTSDSNRTGQKLLHCPGAKGQRDKLKILQRDGSGQESLSKSGTGR